MTGGSASVLVQGFSHLVVSQISTRLITFFLNLLTARLLSVDAYGLASVHFHLINTTILFLSREGFRRGCLRAQQVRDASGTNAILGIAALCIPFGAVVTLCVCAVALRGAPSLADPYAAAVLWQGLAAMVELVSEPLYILAQVRLQLQVRVVAEAAATLVRGVLTLALLKTAACDVGIALSLAQLAYAAVTLLVYGRHFAPEVLSSCSGQAGGRAPQTAPGKAAAVLGYSLAATAPDDPPSNIPPPLIAELPAGSPSAADGPALQSVGDGNESPDKDVSVEQDDADADGWELLSKRAADTAEQATELHDGSAADCTQSVAAAGRFRAELREKEAGITSAERSQQEGLRRRGTSRHAGEGITKAEEEDVGSNVGGAQGDKTEAAGGYEATAGPLSRMDVIWICGVFTLQALEKLLLAEGSKMVMVAFQSSYNQGVYGLVSNLGSLVVRTIFQPFEEAAFLAFSRSEPGLGARDAAAQRSKVLAISTRCVTIVGLLAIAFGPAYTFVLLRMAYGQRWSHTDAPQALGVYCAYILLLAVNGILEAFVHATARSRDITVSNVWLVVCSGVHLALAVALVRTQGAVGLIAADSLNMVLRIAYCLYFIRRHFSAVPGHSLRDLFPSRGTLLALCAASAVTLGSNILFLGGLGLPRWVAITAAVATRGLFRDLPSSAVGVVGLWPAAVGHVTVGGSVLVVTLYAVYLAEGKLVKDMLALRRAAA
ncbi:probable protein RFT1 homolog [Coccomyxa sp. Obi]|nr:probable protein RFT1 homolog [Coccomyxa sp. Obi]